MKAKKLFSLALCGLMAATMLTACTNSNTASPSSSEESSATEPSSSEPQKKEGKITFMTNVVGEQATVLQEVIKDFENEIGYTVEFSAPGESYEELMKTKMSSKELPDVFTTHGWSVLRYSEYLEPVNNMDFASEIIDQMKPVISDKDGNMYVLPMDADIAGLVYNVDVLESAGVKADDIKTWDDFNAACKKIKDNGVTPLHVGGKDSWTIGQFGDWLAPSFFVTDDSNNKKDDLKAGKFDAATWEKVASLMDGWVKDGYFNEDSLTADYNSDVAALADGTAAFGFYGNSAIVDARKVNPDAKLGMMPIPSNSKDDEPSLIAGERIAVGVWKDSPQKEAAIELLNYLATPDVIKKVASSSGNPAGLKGCESDIGDIQTYIDQYASVTTYPYFDREYLPSGMWDVMCSTGADILAQKDNCIQNAGKVMEQNFSDKFSQE